ncbi:MAG: nucleotidyl transferase AbiEii/AbiGii toxin family protein [Planctomycetota bacterium]
MDSIARSPESERSILFRETAARRSLASAVLIEKDFWVCWTLLHIYRTPNLPSILLKGGTSLSKGFQLIDRFSEGIDLAFDRAAFGFTGSHDPANITRTKARARALDRLEEQTTQFVNEEFLRAVRGEFAGILSPQSFNLLPDAVDPLTLLFSYPPALDAQDYAGLTYVRPQVRLEMGARSDHYPSRRVDVRCYAAEEFPDLFTDPNASVTALAPERTFWEKATLLHAENHRPPPDGERRSRARLSRHLYDLVMMTKRGVADAAIDDLPLLDAVAAHKQTFFPAAWARYDLAVPGTLKLVPTGEFRTGLRQDYRSMRSMFFGEPPSFEELLQSITELQERINTLA